MLVDVNLNPASSAGVRRRRWFVAFVVALVVGEATVSPLKLFAQGPELSSPTRTETPPESVGEIADRPAPVATVAQAPGAQPKASLAEAMDRPGDVTFRDLSIEAALFTIGETWKVNIISGKEVQGTVNGVFKQAPLREILDAILLANGYSYRAVGDSLVVQPVGNVGSANPLFRSLTVSVMHGNLQEIVAGAKLLASAEGQIQPLPSAQSLLVIDYADRVESIAAFVARMEEAAGETAKLAGTPPQSQLDVAYFHTHYIPVATAQQPLLTVLSPLGRIGVMPRENRLLVVDYADNIAMVRKVLAKIDRPRPQVRITALIYDLSLKDVEKLGLNWGSAAKGNTVNDEGVANQALKFETTTIAPLQTGSAGGAFTIRSLTRNFDIVTVLNLLQTANDARLLANPNVVVTDNELAVAKSVSEIPYQQITQSELGGQIGTTAFKEAGVTLQVQPTIAGDGTIEMQVQPAFSRLAGFTPGENQPIIDTRTATTRVRVANRQTVVISGLRQRSDTGEFNGIPWLKDVKYVGPLFRSRDTDVRESELIVFLMPEIVSYDEEQSPREYQAVETINCRLDGIPPAEGCPGCQAASDPCAGVALTSLPAVEGEDAPNGVTQPAELPPPAASALRPAYEARFRAENRSSRNPGADGDEPPPPVKKPIWKRVFGS